MESSRQKVVISLEDSDDEVVILVDDTRVVISLDDSEDEVQICEPFETKKRKLDESAVGKTRRQREYDMLADLTDYPHLAAMFAAEKIWRQNKKKKNKKKRNKKQMVGFEAQNQKADATEEENQALSSEAVKTIAFKACDEARSAEVTDLSSLSPEKDEVIANLGSSDALREMVPTKAIADATEEENQAHSSEAVKTIAFKVYDEAKSAEVTDISSLSPEKDEAATNLGSSDALGEMVPTKVMVREELTTIKTQETDADATEEENQAHSSEAVKTIVAFKAFDEAKSAEVTDLSSLSPEKDEVTTNLGSSDGLRKMVPTKVIVSEELTRIKAQESDADATKEENQAHSYEAVKTIAFKACDGARSAGVTVLSSLSLENDEITTNLGSLDGLGETVLTKAIVSEELTRIKAQEGGVEIADEEKQVDSSKDEETKSVETTENIVLRNLLRGPRYFDHPESSRGTCFSCGADDHIAVNCIVKKQKKPCFICGGLEHIAKQCKQRKACTICGGRGHINKDCTEKHPATSGSSKFCLRCGDSGHDMFLCNNDYSPEDIKKIQCYVCKALGHLCCAEFINEGPKQVSCYNCGQSGHLGSGCPRSIFRCFRCGEEGHYARNCTNIATAKLGTADLATSERFPKEKKGTIGLGYSTSELGSHKLEYKKSTSVGQSRWMHGGNTIRPQNLFNGEARANVWLSPAISAKMSQEMPAFSGFRQVSGPQYPQHQVSGPQHQASGPQYPQHQVSGPQHQASGPQHPQHLVSGPQHPQHQVSGPQHPQHQVSGHQQNGFLQVSGPQYPQQNFNRYAGSQCSQAYQTYPVSRHDGS
ncbi:uncharacterized protein LOC132293180 isoform X2 [Cornus florida]|uniref:uncharacterized protein LOC132293180 isoform X2 n=1 Tax=Cornus florida TaxID=4283 RepID=UPI00289B4D7C|nr:uncharacterized protein LOC132293180 isoform X2 [Cornus florida]